MGGRPSFVPSQPRRSVGKGSRCLCFRGRLGERPQQGLEPRDTGRPTVRAVTAGLCYPQWVEGVGLGWGSRKRVTDSLPPWIAMTNFHP